MSKNIISGQHNGYDFVEIGGIKWATCNVGAEKPTDAGLYFQWGDRKGYAADEVGKVKRFNWKDYKHHNGKRITKYTEFDGKLVLDLCDDAAFAYMGHGWRMPTLEDFRCLIESATHRWTKNYHNSGIAGMVFTDRTDKTKQLFFPAIGYCIDGDVYSVGCSGYYWSGSIYSVGSHFGCYLDFNGSGMTCLNTPDYRDYGSTVRGILTF